MGVSGVMSIFKNISQEVSVNDNLLEVILEQVKELIKSFPVPRLGLSEDLHTGENTKKGDIVLHAHDKKAYVVTGEEHEGKHIIANKHKRQAVHPTDLTSHHFIDDTKWKKFAHTIANKHPSRGVYLYQGKPKNVIEAVVNLCDQPLPSKDKGIPSTWKMPKAGTVSKGGEINNNKKPFGTSMKQAGKFNKHVLGDKDPGNPLVTKQAKKNKGKKK